ncbi:MAG: DegT/DnrJ/EryC1/StrS family aminotransferase [Anaerolineae bacterium]
MTILPMSSPDLTDADRAAVAEVLTGAHLSLGPRLEAFERAVAAVAGLPHGVGVNSGTSALHLAVIAAGVRPGDQVITTPFSFIASANCILYEGGLPIFVDVDPTTGNIDPALVAQAADDLAAGDTRASRWLPPSCRGAARPPAGGHRAHEGEGHRPSPASGRGATQRCALGLRALLPVHAFGQPADMDPLLATAARHGLAVIEDACEALGAAYKGRPAGSLGDCAAFAFYPNKQITTGEGGMLVTARPTWADLFRSLRNQGRDVFDAWLNHTRLGYNYRLDELSAALGLSQMSRLDGILAARARVAGWYAERLAGLEAVETPVVLPETTRMSWFVYVIRLRPPAPRDDILRRLAEQGIPSRPYFTPIHLQPFYRQRFGYAEGDFPITEDLGARSLALPFSAVMTEAQVDHVCATLKQVI